jgi:hypothetical protein
MDLANTVSKIVLRLNNERPKFKPHIQLSVPFTLCELPSNANKLEMLFEKLLAHALAISHPSRRIRVAVYEKRKMSDLEKFFSISPRYWFHFRVEIQAEEGLENGAKAILEDLGYRCSEWVGVEDSESQLGAFHIGVQDTVALVLYIRNHRSRRNCDFLVPVIESMPSLAHAI